MLALQIRQLREVFDGIDHTGDGTVDRAEFRRYMSHVEALRPHLTLFNEAESIFSSLDRRKNGTLCFADVRMLPLTLAPDSRQTAMCKLLWIVVPSWSYLLCIEV